MKQVILITGASSGIGKVTALELQKRGYIVYGAARRMDKMADLEAQGIHILPLDVTSDESMTACVQTIIDEQGRIDVLVNNAGYGSHGAIEDVPMDEARRQMEVNVIGLARMSQLALPHMRSQHTGKIINITSMGGRVWSPFGGWYHATKFAVEGLTHCMRLEVKPFGIHMVLIEPGGINTPWGIIAAANLKKMSMDSAYAASANRAADKMHEAYSANRYSDPQLIAKTIARAIASRRPRTRYLVGAGAKPAVFIQSLLGDRIYDWLILKTLG